MKIAFLITAVWWVAFSVPLIRDVHQTHYKERAPRLIRDTFAGLFRTLKRIWKDRRLRYFMLAFFCYIDGVHTIIKMSTSYGTDLGIDATQLVLALLVTQFVAFPSAIAYGPSVHKIRHEAHAAGSYRRVLLHHAVRGVLPARGRGVLDAGHLRGVVPGRHPSAVAQRVRQAHSEGARQRVLRLLRHLRQVRCVMGTFLVSFFTQLSGNSSLGVLSIAVLFVLGFVLLWRMPESRGRARGARVLRPPRRGRLVSGWGSAGAADRIHGAAALREQTGHQHECSYDDGCADGFAGDAQRFAHGDLLVSCVHGFNYTVSA